MPLQALRPGPVDVHTHTVPQSFIDRLARGERQGFSAAQDGEGKMRITLGGRTLAPMHPFMNRPDKRLAAMAEQGVEAQFLSPWIAFAAYGLSEADGAWMCEVMNEEIAAEVRSMPDRLRGLGTVTLQAPERAATLLRSAVRELDLVGVEIATHAGPERFLDEPDLDPFWAEAEALGALIFIHPTVAGKGKAYERYYLHNLVHNPLETTYTAAHLIFGGVMERFPGLKIMLAHGGGFLPYNLGRLIRGRFIRPEAQVTIKGSVEESASRFLYDTVTHSASGLKFLVGEVRPENVFLGSDYPFDMADPDPVRTVKASGLEPSVEQAILRGNVDRLLGAPVPA